jgi:hypothetical protein
VIAAVTRVCDISLTSRTPDVRADVSHLKRQGVLRKRTVSSNHAVYHTEHEQCAERGALRAGRICHTDHTRRDGRTAAAEAVASRLATTGSENRKKIGDARQSLANLALARAATF